MESTAAREVEVRDRSKFGSGELYPFRAARRSAGDGQIWNWAGNAVLAGRSQFRRPRTEKGLRRLVVAHPGRVRVVGSRFSAGPLLGADDTGELLVDMTAIAGVIDVSDDTITFAGAPSFRLSSTR